MKLEIIGQNPLKYPEIFKIYTTLQCAAPHSMVVERVVSMYNKVKTSDRSTISISSLRNNLLVSINGVGTAHFDPLPAVGKFLNDKDRRLSQPNVNKYVGKREFTKKFFHPDNKIDK